MNTDDPICPICHVGRLRTNRITYTQVFDGQFIVIPNVTALVCDVCGEKVFNHETLTRLSGLLGQDRQEARPAPWRQSWP